MKVIIILQILWMVCNAPLSNAQVMPSTEPSYMIPRQAIDGGFHYIPSDTLKFGFNAEYTTQVLTYTLQDEYLNVVMSDTLPNNMLNPGIQALGDNRYILDLSCNGVPMPNGTYMLTVCNEKEEKWYLKFVKNGNSNDDCDNRQPINTITIPIISTILPFILNVFSNDKVTKQNNK